MVGSDISVGFDFIGRFIPPYEPSYETKGSSGVDLRADVLVGAVFIAPGQRAVVPTGIRVRLPKHYDAQCRSRSGLAAKHGLMVLNSPGTIDNDYTGEIKVILVNFGDDPFIVEPGMRIAQLVFSEQVQAQMKKAEFNDDPNRGARGFGSTGTT
jgi:dUTP pyrophosphatase